MSDEFFSGMFASSAASGAASSAATSATTMAAESAALAQSGATAASVTAAGQASAAAQTAAAAGTAATAATYANYASSAFSVLQGLSGSAANRSNAGAALYEGRQAMATAEAEANRERRLNQARLGSIRAAAGAQGTTFEGSPMLAYLDSVKNAALNEQDILYGGQLKQASKKIEADVYKRQAGGSLLAGVAGGLKSLGSTLIS